jgi:hypothetical protein
VGQRTACCPSLQVSGRTEQRPPPVIRHVHSAGLANPTLQVRPLNWLCARRPAFGKVAFRVAAPSRRNFGRALDELPLRVTAGCRETRRRASNKAQSA